MAVLRKNVADKRTEEQRRNDAAQKVRPKGTQDTTYATTGSAAGKVNERDDNPAPPMQEEIPITVVPSKPVGGILDDASNGPGVKRQLQQKGNATRTLRFRVSGQELTRALGYDFSNIIAGTSGYLQVAFEFGSDWDDTIRVAAFHLYLQSPEVGRLIRDGACTVPDEVAACDQFKIGVVGQRENGQRITTSLITIKQERGSGQAW